VFWTKTEQGRYFSFSHTSSYSETNVAISSVPATTNTFQGTDFIVTIVPDSIVEASVRQASSDLGRVGRAICSAEIRNGRPAISARRRGGSAQRIGGTARPRAGDQVRFAFNRANGGSIPVQDHCCGWLIPICFNARQRERS